MVLSAMTRVAVGADREPRVVGVEGEEIALGRDGRAVTAAASTAAAASCVSFHTWSEEPIARLLATDDETMIDVTFAGLGPDVRHTLVAHVAWCSLASIALVKLAVHPSDTALDDALRQYLRRQ